MTPDLRESLLDAALEQAAHGWSSGLLSRAAAAQGLAPGIALSLFPGGAGELAVHFCARGDRQLGEIAERMEAETRPERLRDRVAYFLIARHEIDQPHEAAVRKMLAFFMIPSNTPWALQALGASADAIWRASGDAPADFSYYSKRMILAVIIVQSLVVWLDDHSASKRQAREFVDRKIDDALKWGRTFSRFSGFLGSDDLPNALMRALARMRYPPTPDPPTPGPAAPGGSPSNG